jgi:hypothetical protein
MNIETWRTGNPPSQGQRQRYPARFEYNLRQYYPGFFSNNTLHMFSGSATWGITTDFREETGADIICPFDKIPIPKELYDNVLADPPYANHYQNEWHGSLPKPKHVLREAVRLTRCGGLIGILHIIVIPAYSEYGITRIGLHPILCGVNNAVRVFNVFRKDD